MHSHRNVVIVVSEYVSVYLLTLTGSRSWTGFTWLVPGFSHIVGAAAHLLGHVEGQLVLTRVIEVAVTHTLPHVCVTRRKTVDPSNSKAESQHLKMFAFSNCNYFFSLFLDMMRVDIFLSVQERSLPLTHAVVSSIDLHVFRGTHTGVVAQSVVAGTRSADPNVGCAFINICT